MKIRVLLLILLCISLNAMEQPRPKRLAEEPVEELQGESKTQRGQPGMEPETTRVSSHGAQVTVPTLFGVPATIRNQIFGYLTSAKGATKQIQLINAAQNIRNYLAALNSNQRFRGVLNNKELTDQIIRELAKRYTNNNLVVAAQALATDAASKWVAQEILRNEEILDDWKKAVLTAVKETSDIGAFRFLTHNLAPNNKRLIRELEDARFKTLLFGAVDNNNLELVKELLKAGVHPNNPTDVVWKDGVLIGNLMSLAASKNVEILKALAAAGGDLNWRTSKESNLLSFAGNGQVASYLIQKGLSINDPNQDGFTPLYYAILDGNDDVAKVLLDAGADPNDKESTAGATPLHFAVEKDNATIINHLLAKGADIEAIDEDEDTPLMRAAKEYKLNAAEALLKKGANAQKNIKDLPMFFYALFVPFEQRMENSDPYALVKLFITTQQSAINPTMPPIDLNARTFDDNKTKTFLGYIKSIISKLPEKGLDNFIQFLIEHGAKE